MLPDGNIIYVGAERFSQHDITVDSRLMVGKFHNFSYRVVSGLSVLVLRTLTALRMRQSSTAIRHLSAKFVGGVYPAKGQDSSAGGGAGYDCLCVVHMEEGVQVRVQVEVGREAEKDKARNR